LKWKGTDYSHCPVRYTLLGPEIKSSHDVCFRSPRAHQAGEKVSTADLIQNFSKAPQATRKRKQTEVEQDSIEAVGREVRQFPIHRKNETEVFGDWDPEDEAAHNIFAPDGIPQPTTTKFFVAIQKFFLSLDEHRSRGTQTRTATILTAGHSGKSAAENVPAKCSSLGNGSIFFNHFICLKTQLRHSCLVKAWNRGAAFMTRANTEGIDFVIPIIMHDPVGELAAGPLNLGPLYGEWSAEQESEASKIISYILIDAKNVTSMSETSASMAAEKCKPSQANFNSHKPMNPYITIIMSLGSQASDNHVKFFQSPQEELIGKSLLQIKLGVFGLSSSAYKCLENGPQTQALLEQMLQMDRNPLKGLHKDGKPRLEGG
jgi:hypothetical protein